MLEALDASLLAGHACLFGGGTAIAMRCGEYRESVDIDFLISDLGGYRALRERMTGGGGMAGITRPGASITQTRELRADQYGLRTMLGVAGTAIKFEIVLEARIAFEPSGPADRIAGVATLTPLDMAASKLLANADRWADDAVLSRDLIDLAMLAPPKRLLARALEKARGAYGESIDRDLGQAVQALRDRPHRLDECLAALQMTTIPKALLWKRIKALLR